MPVSIFRFLNYFMRPKQENEKKPAPVVWWQRAGQRKYWEKKHRRSVVEPQCDVGLLTGRQCAYKTLVVWTSGLCEPFNKSSPRSVGSA